MPNTHKYGFRLVGSEHGNEVNPTDRFPVSSAYQAATIVGAGVSVNLNVGDPVYLGEDGCIKLTQSGQDVSGANTDSDDYISHVIMGFERTKASNGDIEQRSFQAGAVSYSGGIGGDNAPIALCIPVQGKYFELDADAVLATPTKAGAMALVGKTCSIVHVPVTAGVIGAPKANPMLDISVAEAAANTDQNQVLIVGLGALGDAMDFTATGVTFKVKVSAPALSQLADPTIFGANVE